jgi:O-Antigen ligase
VRSRALKHLPVALLLLGPAWVLGARGVWLADWALLATAAVAALLAFQATRCGLRWERPASWFLGILVWATADAVIRPLEGSAASRLIAVGVVALLLAVVARTPRTGAWARLAVVEVAALCGVWQLVGWVLQGGRAAGPFGNPNVGGAVTVFGLAVLPFSGLPLAARVALGVPMIAGVVASGSRGALLAVAAAAAAWALAGAGARIRWAAVVLVVLAGGGLAWRLASDRDPLRFERIRLWSVAARTAVAELPFGCGPSGYADAALPHNFPRLGEFARYARTPGVAESDWLELVATLGVPGLLLAAGLAASLAGGVARAGPVGVGIAAAVVVSSAVNTQLPLPVVAWTAALAVASLLPRGRRSVVRLPSGLAGAAALALAVATTSALALPAGGGFSVAEKATDRAADELRHRPPDDGRLADAEATAWEAAARRPRFAHAWSVLGRLRLARAELRRDGALAEAAARAFARARKVDRLDVWSALGEGQARRLLGDRRGAEQALRAAVELEPNCVPAWLETALLRLEAGELRGARAALTRAEAALRLARGRSFVTEYERALAHADPTTLARLRARSGEGP